MSCKYILLFLFLCSFAALSDSTNACENGMHCTLKLQTKNNEKPNEIKWVHLSSDDIIHRKNGKIRKNSLGGKIEEDGSLTFESVSLKNTGKYKYSFYAADGTEISKEVEIQVYAKPPKPTVTFDCLSGNVNFTCGFAESEGLTVTWYTGAQIIKGQSKKQLLLPSAEVQEKTLYSCSVSIFASKAQSDSITVSCRSLNTRTLFGFDFWIMVSILAGGGALVLLLICVLVICACRSCKKQNKHQQDEDELRLRVFQDEAHTGTARSKHTARGQPAPPIPQEDPSPQTPTQTQSQPKAQTRSRPPPPPENDEENPPPLPRPRNKQHRKRHEEPYRPME